MNMLARPGLRLASRSAHAPCIWSPIRSATCRQWLHSASRQAQSSTATSPRATQPTREFAYPENINVFVSPAGQTALYGIMRICTTGIFLMGSLVLGTNVYFNPDASNLWVPACIVGSAIPAAIALLFGPYITSIRVLLPTSARRSQDSLRRFMSAVPPRTIATFTFLRFAPWPLKRSIFFSDLRRLPHSRLGGAQFEYVPLDHKERVQTERGVMGWFVRKYFCQFWINSTANRVGGLPAWNMMWDQIPVKGETLVSAPSSVASTSPTTQTSAVPTVGASNSGRSQTKHQRAPPPPMKPRKR